ncbi:MAG TPA: alpha/beta fold hydrolase [Candidatus Omnitrophota bacterium]|nr:alpha/beta fold hydrolase [Candidatus Omnitrophota bacterium]
MTMRVIRLVALAMVALVSACGGGAHPQSQPTLQGGVMTEEFLVDAKDDGVRLFIRNKRPAEYYNFRPEKTVLFLHGATFAGHSTFDLALDGTSWMDWMARRGYDVYALDIRGYGKSTRPDAMGRPADQSEPLVDSATALRDVSKAVDFITSRRNLQKLVLVGWSWGGTLAGQYATSASERVERLVLVGPQWLRDQPAPADMKLGAWRGVPLAQAQERWLKAVPAAEQRELVPAHWLKAFADANQASDPDGARMDPPVLRAPNGVAADALKTWAVGVPAWHPEKVSSPTLVVQGEWDSDNPPAMGLGVFSRLAHAPQRRYLLIGEGSHMLMLEKNREHLFRAVQAFLEERL